MICFSLCISFSSSALALDSSYDGSGNIRKLKWADEFNGNELDMRNWMFEEGDMGGYSRAYYHSRKENVNVHDGLLDIKSEISFNNNGKYVVDSEYSGSIDSKNRFDFKYGELEIRAKMATGKGVASTAFSMGVNKAWPLCGEADLFEYRNDTNTLTQAIHTRKFSDVEGGLNPKTWMTGIDANIYHVYKMVLAENYIEYYIDDKLQGVYNPFDYSADDDPTKDATIWPFNQSMYLTIRNAMNPSLAGDRSPDGWTLTKTNEDSKDYETHTYIDYVRLYQYEKAPEIERFERSTPKFKSVSKKYKSKKIKIKLQPLFKRDRFDGVSIRVFKNKKKAKGDKGYCYYTKINKYKTNITISKKKFKNKRKLYVKVKYYKQFGDFIYYSKYSAIKKVKIKK